jgi:hypothetical protein
MPGDVLHVPMAAGFELELLLMNHRKGEGVAEFARIQLGAF